MLKQSNNKFKKIFKGALCGMAVMLSFTSLPIASIAGAFPKANDAVDAAISQSVDFGSISLAKASKTATKGLPYKIGEAKFNKGSTHVDKAITDNNTSDEGLKTDITVKYKNTNHEFEIKDGEFVPTLVGTYTISYYVKDTDGKEYTYDYDIYCEVGEAKFDFSANDENVLPNVYDPSMFVGKEAKKIKLPMPKLFDSNGEELKDKNGEKIKYYAKKQAASVSDYILVTIDNAEEGSAIAKTLTVDTENGSAEIDGEALAKVGEGVYEIKFTYYQNGAVVSTTSKTLDIKDGYYKKSSASDAQSGSDLLASFSTATPDDAKTGVEVNLPAVIATTSETNKPSKEAVNVHYDVTVMRKDKNGDYSIDDSEYVDLEKNVFVPPEDGDYLFTYTVKDFYGNSPDKKLTFRLNGVKDKLEPTVFIYNAKDYKDLNVYDNKEFESAKADIKNETGSRNVVIYAIGATDNCIKKGVTYTREIRDPNGFTKFAVKDVIPAQDKKDDDVHYNNYNLILNFDKEKFFDDNYAIASARTADEKSKDVEQFLKDNNFLIVTQEPPVEGTSVEEYKKQLLAEGKAYVPRLEEGDFEFDDVTYSLYYQAEDAAGNKTQPNSVSIEITTDNTYADEEVPTITFPTSLKTAYQPDEVISFEKPRFTDSADDDVRGNVFYRYLKSDKKTAIEVDGSATLAFDVNTKSALVKDPKDSKKWYDTAGSKSEKGFVRLEEGKNGSYSIDLKNRPTADTDDAEAVYVEVFVYGVDDYGNMGFYQNIIKISGTGDAKEIDLQSVETKENAEKVAGDKIELPTLVYSDDHVEYMTHGIEVYYIYNDGESTELISMPSENSSNIANSRTGKFTVYGGTFTASYSGTYRAVVTVRDAGNNSIATFFDFTVDANERVEDPVVDNLSGDTITLDVGEEFNLVPPSLKVDERGNVGYAGYDQQDDAKRALYYNIKTISAETNNYSQNQDVFKATRPGNYELQYDVFVIKYNKAAQGVSIVDGELHYALDGADYLVLPARTDDTTIEVYKVNAEDKTLTLAADKHDAVVTATGAEIKQPPTNIQKFMVVDKTAPVLNIDGTEYNTRTELDNTTIEIERIAAIENDDRGLDPTTSYVQVKIDRAKGGQSNYKIYMQDWDNDREGTDISYNKADKKLELHLVDNAEYTITYYAFDYSGKASDPASFTFRNGDAQRPTIEILDGFLDKAKDQYKLGDDIQLDLSKLLIEDTSMNAEGADKDAILKGMKDRLVITVFNTTTNTEIKPIEGSEYKYHIDTAGTYRITVTTTDPVGWSPKEDPYVEIKIASSKDTQATVSKRTIGIILIAISCLILVGVVGYFIYSKFKLDKEAKGLTNKKKKSKK